VVSIDASAEMVKATTLLTGKAAILLSFEQMEYEREFEGVWACASLLHVTRTDLGPVLGRFTNALKPNGVLYLSFKYGDAERFERGRFFNDLNEALLKSLLADRPQLHLLNLWVSDDVRSERRGYQRWLNALIRARQRRCENVP
jgi:hypothetical protein